MLCGVIYSDIPHIWEQVKPHLSRSIKYANGKYDIQSIRQLLDDRSAQLWIEFDKEIESAAVTQISIYPLKKVCTVLFAGGQDLDKFKHNIRRIEEWAKAQDCDDVEVIGRRGWARVLSDYSDIHTTLSKKL